MPTNTVNSLSDILLNFLGRREMEKRYEDESVQDLQRFLRGGSGGAGAGPAPEMSSGAAPMGRAASDVGQRVVVEPTGAVRDAGNWFSSIPRFSLAPRPWVHDSENFFTPPGWVPPDRAGADIQGSDNGMESPSGGAAAVPIAAPAAVSPRQAGGGLSLPTTGAPGQDVGGGVDLGGGGMDRSQVAMFMQLAARAGIDPKQAEEIVNLQVQRDRQAQALQGLDPYAQGNLVFGKTAALPFVSDAYGTTNRVTGAVSPSDYARAAGAAKAAEAQQTMALTPEKVAAEQALTGQRQAVATDHAAAAAQTLAMTPERLASEQALTAQREAVAESRRRVKLADGRVVEAYEGPDGRLVASAPIAGPDGQAIKGEMPAESRQFARGPSPQAWFMEQYRSRLNLRPSQPERAFNEALADTRRVYPGFEPSADPGSAGGQGSAPVPTSHQMSPSVQAPVRPAAPVDPVRSAVTEALAKIDADAAEVILLKPQLRAKVEAAAAAKKRAIMQLGGAR